MTHDDDERRLVRRLQEGDDSALAHLRALWLRCAGVADAMEAVAGPPGDASVVLLQGRIVLLWVAGAKRWEVVAFEPDE